MRVPNDSIVQGLDILRDSLKKCAFWLLLWYRAKKNKNKKRPGDVSNDGKRITEKKDVLAMWT